MHLSKRCIIRGRIILVEVEVPAQVGTHTTYMGTCSSSNKRKGLFLGFSILIRVTISVSDYFVNGIDFKPPLISMDNPSLLRHRRKRKPRPPNNSNKCDKNKLPKPLQWLLHNSKLSNNMPHNLLNNSTTGNTRT